MRAPCSKPMFLPMTPADMLLWAGTQVSAMLRNAGAAGMQQSPQRNRVETHAMPAGQLRWEVRLMWSSPPGKRQTPGSLKRLPACRQPSGQWCVSPAHAAVHYSLYFAESLMMDRNGHNGASHHEESVIVWRMLCKYSNSPSQCTADCLSIVRCRERAAQT